MKLLSRYFLFSQHVARSCDVIKKETMSVIKRSHSLSLQLDHSQKKLQSRVLITSNEEKEESTSSFVDVNNY